MMRRYFPILLLLAFLILTYGFVTLSMQRQQAAPDVGATVSAFFAELETCRAAVETAQLPDRQGYAPARPNMGEITPAGVTHYAAGDPHFILLQRDDPKLGLLCELRTRFPDGALSDAELHAIGYEMLMLSNTLAMDGAYYKTEAPMAGARFAVLSLTAVAPNANGCATALHLRLDEEGRAAGALVFEEGAEYCRGQ